MAAKFGYLADKPDPMMMNPSVHIILEDYWANEDGTIFLSSECCVIEEVDGQVNYMIDQLQKVAKNAKAELTRLRKVATEARRKAAVAQKKQH